MRSLMPLVPLIPCSLVVAACGGSDAFTPVTTGKNLKVAALTAEEDCMVCVPTVLEEVLGRQTPSELKAGILSVELLRTPFDTEPHVLLQSDTPVETDT